MNKGEINLYEMALGLASGIGGKLARNLLSYIGSAEQIFKASKKELLKTPMVGEKIWKILNEKSLLTRAEKEIEACQKDNISLFFLTQEAYPYRLKNIPDAPPVIYVKGNPTLNEKKVIAIVGTRKSTNYGKDFIQQLFADLDPKNLLVVSGLAYGIDINAHRQSLKHKIPTLGVLANGIDIVYPSSHFSTAKEMVQCGGLLSESPLGTKPDAPRFPARNRIIAGLSDAVIVVEAMTSGGAVITANLANDYDRDVFAVPGALHQKASQGCNRLIKTHKANLIESCDDLRYIMGWDKAEKQMSLFEISDDLSTNEKAIIEYLKQHGDTHIDTLSDQLKVHQSQLSISLLQLELQNIINTLPGKKYNLSSSISI